ncbi:MAG: NAD(P)-binding protein, partial [Myxococcaceae bacterium]|nr:NAD(P)-binding protein [Myxococcaceae bacterium]
MRPDLLLIGGGLANGLLAARLAEKRPELSVQLLEAGHRLGGNHTWSFHETDVPASALPWLRSLGARPFAPGHDVVLPGLGRTLGGTYWSLRSPDFHDALQHLPVRYGVRVDQVGPTHAVLSTGERVTAAAVIDARGTAPAGLCGWQKFFGQDVELSAPHGLQRPLLMDATVEQLDGFRFFYALPWSPTRVLIEDTTYADTPDLAPVAARRHIAAW